RTARSAGSSTPPADPAPVPASRQRNKTRNAPASRGECARNPGCKPEVGGHCSDEPDVRRNHRLRRRWLLIGEVRSCRSSPVSLAWRSELPSAAPELEVTATVGDGGVVAT